MKRRQFLLSGAALLWLCAAPVHAGVEDDIMRQLRAQGFSGVSLSTTLLGRSRILGMRKGGTREIIVNPRTGEILRDLWTLADGTTGKPGLLKDDDSSGEDSGDDSGGDDGGDDGGGDDGGDNSGHGGDGGDGGEGGEGGGGD